MSININIMKLNNIKLLIEFFGEYLKKLYIKKLVGPPGFEPGTNTL